MLDLLALTSSVGWDSRGQFTTFYEAPSPNPFCCVLSIHRPSLCLHYRPTHSLFLFAGSESQLAAPFLRPSSGGGQLLSVSSP